MEKFTSYLLTLFLGLFISCQSKRDQGESQFLIHKVLPEIRIHQVDLDTLEVSYDGFVGKGFSVISGEKIHFLNQLKMELIEFDREGNFLGVLISSGRGPNEVPRFQSYLEAGGKKYFLDGYTILTYDSTNNLINKRLIDFYHTSSMESVENDPNTKDQGVYEIKYWANELGMINGYLYTKVESSNPKFNFVMHEAYYREAALYAQIDLKTGKVLKVMGNRPNVYLNYRFIPHFDYFYHDIQEKEVYLSFEPDSLIYVADLDFKIKEAFGAGGSQMDTDYIEVNTIDDWEAYWRNNRVHKGFYRYIKYFPKDKVLFRTYTVGSQDHTKFEYEDNPQRMQIFQDRKLIGDVAVPNTFKVIGKIGDDYYADGSVGNLNNEKIVIYRFKLP